MNEMESEKAGWADQWVMQLIEMKEYAVLARWFEETNLCFDQLSEELKMALIETKAAMLLGTEAFVLYKKLGVKNLRLLAKVYFLLGENELALENALNSKDPFLVSDILLSLGRYQEALHTLQHATVGPKWYYYLGRCYNHLFQIKKAQSCHKKAIKLYLDGGYQIQAVTVMADLATFSFENGDLTMASEYFDKVRARIKNSEMKNFPKLYFSSMLQFGYFKLNHGDLNKALWLAVRASKVAQEIEDTYDYARAQIFLSNVAFRLGHFRRGIEILETLEPIKQFQRMDKARRLATSHAALGQSQRALNELALGEQLLESGDRFGRNNFWLDQLRIYFENGKWELARTHYLQCINALMGSGEEHVMIEFQSCYAYWTQDENLARISLENQIKYNFAEEACQDRLTILQAALIKNEVKGALDQLVAMDRSETPFLEGQRLIYLAIAHFKEGNFVVANQSALAAFSLLKSREHYGWLALALHILLILKRSAANFAAFFAEYQICLARLSQGQRILFNRLIGQFGITFEQDLVVQAGPHTTPISSVEAHALCLASHTFALDLVQEKIFLDGGEFLGLDNHRNPKAILFFIAGRAGKIVSKEELATQVLGRTGYNPLTDDNLIYVTLNRLKKNLKVKDLILPFNSGYILNEQIEVLIIRAAADYDRHRKLPEMESVS